MLKCKRFHYENDAEGVGIARQTVNFLQRDRIIGCKFCQVPLAVEFRTGVLLLNGQKTKVESDG